MRRTIIFIVGLLCTMCNANAQAQMQREFEKFLSLFPTITWKNILQEIVVDNIPVIESHQQIPYEVLRRNMWYEEPQNGPQNVFNHIRNEIKSADYNFKTPPPHIIDVDGDYMHYEKMGGYGDVYPIGKVDVAEDIVLIIIYNKIYKSRPIDDSDDFRYEFYTFRKSTQQMISAYLASNDNNLSYFNDDFTFIFFEHHGNELSEDESVFTDWSYAHRKVVKLLPNGYFAEIERRPGFFHWFGYIQDSDGYSNVRKSANGKSEILYQVKDSSFVDAYGSPNGSWYEVVYVKEKGARKANTEKVGGYIHKSRLRDFEKWRNSLRHPEYKE